MRYERLFLLIILISVLLSFSLLYLAGVFSENRIQTNGDTSMDAAWAVIETSDGGYALAGHTQSFGTVDADFWLIKTDKDGNVEWNQTYGGEKFETAYSLVETSDGGYALVGRTGYLAPEGYDVVLIKTDKNGNVEWNQTYGGEMSEEAYSLVVTSDGGFIIAGYTSSSGYEYPDFWLTKTDANGNMQWNRTYG